MKNFRKLLICLVALLSSCTGGKSDDAALLEIDRLCDSIPLSAMSKLDSIDRSGLKERDRHYYDLLYVKSRDKAYMRHTSDSLILDIIEYYSSHKDDGHYPEALYYGGRVYSDIGDYPTALKYFQEANNAIPDDKKNVRFKSTVLNQTGRLLHSLRLDSDAIGYLEKSLDIEKKFKNNYYGLAFTHKLLGYAYLNIGDEKKAISHIRSAYKLSEHLPASDRTNIAVDYAELLSFESKHDSALNIIRTTSLDSDTLSLNKNLAVASEVYCINNIIDTAYIYARLLTRSNEPNNKRTGYKVIFSDELRNFVPKDTLLDLIPEYKKTLEDYLDMHESEQALIHNTKYNYDLHVRERNKTEIKLHLFMFIAGIALILFLSTLTFILYRKFKTARDNARFMTVVNVLKEDTFASTKDVADDSPTGNREPVTGNSEKLSEIKSSILSGISAVNDRNLENIINKEILDSSIYLNLHEKINSASSITLSEENMIWSELEKLVDSVSSGFGYRLQILTEGRITPNERKVAMLIKCGFSPLQISMLLGKQKNTVSTHRGNIAFKITGHKKADRTLDLIIISL